MTEPTPTQKEMNALKKFLKIYFLAIAIFYLASIVGRYSGFPFPENAIISFMSLIFATPLLLALVYLCRSICFLFQKDWELFKISVFHTIVGVSIGIGVCWSNLLMASEVLRLSL